MKPQHTSKVLTLILSILLITNSCKNEYAENLVKTFTQTSDSTLNINDTIASNLDSITPNNTPVNQVKPIIDSTKKYIYLTFDDGPYKGSKNINQIIQDENIKATVFIVGLNAYTKDLKQHIVDYQNNNLIEVSNHTFSHGKRNKFKQYYNNPNGVLDDVIKNDTFFKLTNKIVRLPGRNTWRVGEFKKNDFDNASKTTSDLLDENQFSILGWDYEWNKINKHHPLDHPQKIYDGIKYRFDKNLTTSKNHLVLLMHDDMFNKPEDAEKLRTLIKMLKTDPDIIFEIASNYPTTK